MPGSVHAITLLSCMRERYCPVCWDAGVAEVAAGSEYVASKHYAKLLHRLAAVL